MSVVIVGGNECMERSIRSVRQSTAGRSMQAKSWNSWRWQYKASGINTWRLNSNKKLQAEFWFGLKLSSHFIAPQQILESVGEQFCHVSRLPR